MRHALLEPMGGLLHLIGGGRGVEGEMGSGGGDQEERKEGKLQLACKINENCYLDKTKYIKKKHYHESR